MSEPMDSDNRGVYLELLKLKSSESATLMSSILRVETLFLALTGALLKFALDAHATRELRLGLSWLGLLLAGFLWLAAWFAELYRRELKSDLETIYAELEIKGISADSQSGMRLGIMEISATNIVIVAGWVYLIITT